MSDLTARSVKLTDVEWGWLAEQGRKLSPFKPLSYGEVMRLLIRAERDRQQQATSNGKAKRSK